MVIELSKLDYDAARFFKKGKTYDTTRLSKQWGVSLSTARLRMRNLTAKKVLETKFDRDPNGRFDGFRVTKINPFKRGMETRGRKRAKE